MVDALMSALSLQQTFGSGTGMSALGQKQTFALQNVMSALPPKADMCSATRDVRFVPRADISSTPVRNDRGRQLRRPLDRKRFNKLCRIKPQGNSSDRNQSDKHPDC